MEQKHYLAVLNGNELYSIKSTDLKTAIFMLAKDKYKEYPRLFNLKMFELAMKGCETTDQMIDMYNVFCEEEDSICEVFELARTTYENPEMTPIPSIQEYKEL